jgi:serine O-acetyltransferase
MNALMKLTPNNPIYSPKIDRVQTNRIYPMTRDPDFKADLARYPRRPFLREQSIWAIGVYRFGRRVLNRKPGVTRNIQLKVYWFIYRIVETLTGITLPIEARIGPGLRIYHFGNIFIHPHTVIGRNCTLRQGVTIGNRVVDGPPPIVEDDVEFGAYAQALGGIHISRGAKIGAMSVVLCDVPEGATAVGVPARILSANPALPRTL